MKQIINALLEIVTKIMGREKIFKIFFIIKSETLHLKHNYRDKAYIKWKMLLAFTQTQMAFCCNTIRGYFE